MVLNQNPPIYITNSEIRGNVNFDHAIMMKSIRFGKTKFGGSASFNKSQFNEKTSFTESLFNKSVSFEEAQFKGNADFGKSKFHDYVNFLHTAFTIGPVDFEDCEFNSASCFNYAEFNSSESTFSGTRFGGPVSFWHAKFSGDADFTGAFFKESANFNFIQFKASSDFLGSRFMEDLYFNSAKFDKFRISWDSIGNRLITDGPTYILLIKNFRELEQFEDADNCYFYYREWKRNSRPLGLSKIFDYLAWLSCGYGVRWHYTILLSIFAIIFFGIYYESYDFINISSNHWLKINKTNSKKYEIAQSFKAAISFSAFILLSLPPEWCPFGKEEYTRKVHWSSVKNI